MTDFPSAACDLCERQPGPPYCGGALCQPCEECGAVPGAACEPFCTAPVCPGGPLERDEP